MRNCFRLVTNVLAIAVALPASGAQPPSALESSFAQARAVLARSVDAYGGAERIGKLSAVRLHLIGELSTGLQGPRPEAVFQSTTEGEFETRVLIDLDKSRSRTSGEQRGFGGFNFSFNAVYTDAAVLIATPFPPQVTRQPVGDFDEGREQTAGIGTRMATPMLLKLATQRLATLRDEGMATTDGRAVHRISFSADKNTRVTLSIDEKTGRVAALEQLAPDPLLGVDTTRWTFSGGKVVDGLMIPEAAIIQRRGIEIIKIRLAKAELDAAAGISDDEFKIDPRFVPTEQPPLAVAEVRPGLWEVSGAAGGFYRMHFAELRDRIVAYDAPVSPSTVKAMIAKLREKVPNKPISHVVLSHFHNDHIGGVRTFAEEGTQIVTTADAAPVVRKIAQATTALVSIVDAPVPSLKLVSVDSALNLGEAGRPLTVRVATGSPHVNRLLVLHDAANRAVIAADMYSDTAPFNPSFDWFAQWLKNVPDADLMLGAHHPPAEVESIFEKQAAYRQQ
jgi:glyoxylase-like metal-dependent hydrolase (beta-lactamase superfamily II)